MDPSTNAVNPYRAPDVRVEDVRPEGEEKPLAGRWARLAAILIDIVIYAVPVVVMMIVLWDQMSATPDVSFIMKIYAAAIPVFLINCYLLWRDGQTLGKKVVGIRIVRLNGTRASFVRIFILRILAPGVIGWVPIVGFLFGLANVLFIFGPARRCLHDYMADTIVVQAL